MAPTHDHGQASATQQRRHSHDSPVPAQHRQRQQEAAKQRELEEGAAAALASGLLSFGTATFGEQGAHAAGTCALFSITACALLPTCVPSHRPRGHAYQLQIARSTKRPSFFESNTRKFRIGGATGAPSALRSDRRADQAIGIIDRKADQIDR